MKRRFTRCTVASTRCSVLHQTLLGHLRIVMFGMISSVVAVGGLVFAAMKL
jgi:hypothetical protein